MIGIKQAVASLLNGGIKEIGGIIDNVVTTKEEKQTLHNALKQMEMKNHLDLKQMDLDRYGMAHETYGKDSQMQKIYSMVFLIAYVCLSVILIFVFIKYTEMPSHAVALISSILGAMSAKVNTITDFYFGSSSGSQEKNETINAAQKGAMRL